MSERLEPSGLGVALTTEKVVRGDGSETEVIRGVATDGETAELMTEAIEEVADREGRSVDVEVEAVESVSGNGRGRSYGFSHISKDRWPGDMDPRGQWGRGSEHPENN